MRIASVKNKRSNTGNWGKRTFYTYNRTRMARKNLNDVIDIRDAISKSKLTCEED